MLLSIYLFIYMFAYLFSDQHAYTVLKIKKIGKNSTIKNGEYLLSIKSL